MSKQNINIEGMKKSDALTALIQGGMSFVEAEKYWKDNRPAAAHGFTAGFYSELEQGPMSDKRFNEIIEGGSNNIQKHRSHYDAIRSMATAIWANKK